MAKNLEKPLLSLYGAEWRERLRCLSVAGEPAVEGVLSFVGVLTSTGVAALAVVFLGPIPPHSRQLA